MNGEPRLVVVPDTDAVARTAARQVADSLARAIAARGVSHWATSGGSIAPGLYRALVAPPLRDIVDWTRVHVWWGDDRWVPFDHELSNVMPMERFLLAIGGERDRGVPLPYEQVHPFPIVEALAHDRGQPWCAARYADDLRAVGPPPDADGWPVFDLVWVGVGPDGHLLSVFPGSPAFDSDHLAQPVPAPTHIEPRIERMTLHPSIVTAAQDVLVAAAGAPKADVLALAFAGGDPREVPARLAARDGATWVLDRAAAAGLPGIDS